MKKAISLWVIANIFLVSTFSESLEKQLQELLPAKIVTALLSEGHIQNTMYRKRDAYPSLAPDTRLADQAIDNWDGELPPFFSETLYLYKKKNISSNTPTTGRRTISQILRSVSSLEGLEYFSTSRQKMRTLYEKSYTVNNDRDRQRIADPLDGDGDGLVLTAIHKDLTFGEYAYTYAYKTDPSGAAFFSRNIDALKYSFIKLIDSGNLRVSLVVHDLQDHLLIYAITRASFPAIPGIDGKINASFSTRAEAMYNWFISEYEKSN